MRTSSGLRSARHKALRLVVLLVALDLVATWAVWQAAQFYIRRPDEIPPGVPLVVFYTPERLDLEERVQTAAEVYARHGRRPVICVGGSRPSRDFFGSEQMAADLVKRGVAATDTRTERRSFDTIGNAAAARELSSGSRSLILITDALHLFRMRRFEASLFPSTTIITYPTAGDVGPATAWWRVHYELMAYGSELVPDAWRIALLRIVRP